MAAEAEELGEALRSKHWIPSAMHGDLIASIELGRERWLEKVAAAREDEETAAANAVMAAEAEELGEALRSKHWIPFAMHGDLIASIERPTRERGRTSGVWSHLV
jgi:hypothetical protein